MLSYRHQNTRKMFHEIIFPHFGTRRIVISDGGSHFIDKVFKKYLAIFGVNHRVATLSPSNKRVKQKHPTNKSKISRKRLSMKWAKHGRRKALWAIPDSLQNTKRDDPLSIGVWEGMSSTGRTRIQGSLGNQEVGDEFGSGESNWKN